MSEETRCEVIKAAAQGHTVEEITKILNLDLTEVKDIIDNSEGEIKVEKEYRKGIK